MIPRIVPTPVAADRELPVQGREGGFDSALLDAILPAAGTDEGREALQNPRALLVTTGQQPGLLTGPLYTIYKALSAAALARQLSERWERPVIPMFWIAGDDHDFDEANHAAWLTPAGEVRRAVLRKRPDDAPLVPMYREPLGDDITAVLESLAADLPVSESRDAVLAWLGRHYKPEATLAGSFGCALAELLAPLGILCLDSTHAAVKRATIRHIIRALGVSRGLNADLAARDRELRDAGHDAGVGVGDDATLVMLEAGQGRDRLIHDKDGFITRRSGERFTLDDLGRLGAESPERFSGNVLLRPVLESAILPTVAYVAGPGELRYLALTQPVYERLRIPRQLPVPRWSGLLVESRVERTLARFDAGLDDLQRDDH
ncbi:MAG: bacillithiol biosynthesis cysteine-adding enzyme BshC, partial [Gemmatimonadales bacterium]